MSLAFHVRTALFREFILIANDFNEAFECIQQKFSEETDETYKGDFLKSLAEAPTGVFIAPNTRIEPALSAHNVRYRNVRDMGFSTRVINCLDRMGVETVGQLISVEEHRLYSQTNFGQTCMRQVKSILAKYGLRLGGGATRASQA